MKKILRSSQPAEGGGTSAAKPEPPTSALVVEQGKTERELELERKLKATQVEAAHLADENHRLKQIPAAAKPASQPAKEKFSWMGYAQS